MTSFSKENQLKTAACLLTLFVFTLIITFYFKNQEEIHKRNCEYRKTLAIKEERERENSTFVDWKQPFKEDDIETVNENDKRCSIPLNIFQTWETKDETKIPPKMKECMDLLKNQNTEFNYYLFDDKDCLNFIRTYFPFEVSNAYESLLPGAYKADLWRYCVLYTFGGIYVDVKYKCCENFKLSYLTDKEYFVNDWSPKCSLENIYDENGGIYNAFMVCNPKNSKLKKLIEMVVENVKSKYYGKTPLSPTGPDLFKSVFDEEEKKSLELIHYHSPLTNLTCILKGKCKLLEMYTEYREEFKNYASKSHYTTLWKNKNIYI
jgi:mannosyltransferase OCH1-like enzyme